MSSTNHGISLSLKFPLGGATSAMQKFDGLLRSAHQQMSKMGMVSGKASTSIKKVADETKKAKDPLERIGPAGTKAGDKISRGFNKAQKAVRGFEKRVMSSMAGGLNRMKQFAVVSATLVGGKAVYDMNKFSKAFGLMNATLGAESNKTKRLIRQSLLDMSGQYNIAADEITDSMTQLFSSGLAPTAKEGTKEYEKQMKNALAVQGEIAKAAKATGEEVGSMGEAYVFASNNMGLDPTQMETAITMTNWFSSILDNGIGTMDQYSAQMVKIGKPMKQAGATMSETGALFARMTKNMNANMAGFTTKAFADLMNKAGTAVQQGGNFAEQMLGSEYFTLTQKEKNMVAKAQDELQGIFFKQMEMPDGSTQNVKKGVTEMLGSMSEFVQQAPEGSAMKDIFMKMLSTNQNAQKALADLTSAEGYADFQLILSNIEKDMKKVEEATNKYQSGLKKLDELHKTGKMSAEQYATEVGMLEEELRMAESLVNNKLGEVMNTFAEKWGRFTQEFSNKMAGALLEMEPAINNVLTSLTDLVTGDKTDPKKLAEGFALARENLEATYPSLVGLVDLLEMFTEYLTSGKAEAHLAAIVTGLKGVMNFAKRAFNFMKDWGKPLLAVYALFKAGGLIMGATKFLGVLGKIGGAVKILPLLFNPVTGVLAALAAGVGVTYAAFKKATEPARELREELEAARLANDEMIEKSKAARSERMAGLNVGGEAKSRHEAREKEFNQLFMDGKISDADRVQGIAASKRQSQVEWRSEGFGSIRDSIEAEHAQKNANIDMSQLSKIEGGGKLFFEQLMSVASNHEGVKGRMFNSMLSSQGADQFLTKEGKEVGQAEVAKQIADAIEVYSQSNNPDKELDYSHLEKYVTDMDALLRAVFEDTMSNQKVGDWSTENLDQLMAFLQPYVEDGKKENWGERTFGPSEVQENKAATQLSESLAENVLKIADVVNDIQARTGFGPEAQGIIANNADKTDEEVLATLTAMYEQQPSAQTMSDTFIGAVQQLPKPVTNVLSQPIVTINAENVSATVQEHATTSSGTAGNSLPSTVHGPQLQ